MSYTVWQYDCDQNLHHQNDLNSDSFIHLDDAIACARQRVRETNHNTGYAKIIDGTAKRLGASGVVAVYGKDRNGRAYPLSFDNWYAGRRAA